MSKVLPEIPLAEIAKPILRSVEVIPGKSYRTIGVKWWGEGAYERQTIDGSGTAAKSLSLVRQGDLIINKIWVRHGSTAIAGADVDGCAASGEFPTFTLDESRVAPRWLHWQTKTKGFWAKCDALSQGTSGKNRIKPELFLTVRVPLPPLADQRRVVGRIEALAAQIHEARTLRHQAAEEADALTKSTLNQELTAAAKKFGVQPMGAVAKCAAGFGFPKQHQGRTGLKYPFAKVSDMNLPENQRAITTAQNWVGDDDVREMRLKIYPVGTIIFPKIGGAIATNKRRVLSLPATFDNNVMGLIPSEKLSSEYLFAFMQSFDLTELQADTSVPAISQGKVEAMGIPVPPLAEQRRIVAELDALQAEVDALKRLQAETTAELDALLPAILNRAFKGEL
jgi:type I restriction enzyme S subunit